MIVKQPEATKSEERPQKNFMRPRRGEGDRREPSEYEERVIEVRRVARTVAGGRRIRFRALVVIGNKKGKIGMGIGKSIDVSEAVRKAVIKAKKDIVIVPLINGTIPYEVTSKFGSAVVMLRPAATGSSIVAGGAVRTVAELAGMTDLLSKMLGSPNKVNNVVATIKALSSFNTAYTDRVKAMIEHSEKVAKETILPEVVLPVEEPKEAEEKPEPKKPAAAKKAAAKKSMKK